MNLRTQILLSILGVTILAQIVFGLLAYRQISDGRAEQLSASLHRFTEDIAGQISHPDTLSQTENHLEQFRQKFLAQDSILLIQKEGELVFSFGPLSFEISLVEQALADMKESGNQHGQIKLTGDKYYWAYNQLPDTRFSLIIIEPASADESGIITTLQLRLISSGLVILWVAVWIGLILGSKISRELDKKNEELEYQAMHDTLTGLPNRILLNDRVERVLLDARRTHQSFALFLIDLDRFKEINDTLGHHFGDKLLQLVSVRLKESMRTNDSIARLGGDEFAVLLPHTSFEGAELCANRILFSMNKTIVINNITIDVKASIGIAIYPDHGLETDELLKHADIAMYQAKQAQSGFALYDPEQNIHTVRRLRLMSDLRDAIKLKKIYLNYQPIVDARTREIISVEALARWQHPELGNIPPDEFISMAEQTGLINILTMQILDQALKDLKQWHKSGFDLGVSVNLSAYSLQDQSLPVHIESLLKSNDVAAEQVQLEITETALMHDMTRAGNILNALDELGLHLAIDDFGTGFSSLNYLKKLPVNTLKIDRSFIFEMSTDATDRAVVKTVIELGHNLSCHVVAEGVEDQAAVDLLKELQVDMLQGYFISRPIGRRELEVWLHEQTSN